MSKKTGIIAAIACTALLSACAKDMKQSDKLVLQGCAVGGFGAGALAYITHIGDKDVKDKAAIAAMLGCIAGTVAGYHIGKRTEKYADAQQASEKEIALNRQNAKDLKKYNAQLQINIDDYNQQIAIINDSKVSAADKKNNLKKTKSIIANQRDKAKKSLAEVEKDLVVAQNQYSEYKGKTPTEKSEDWSQQLAALQQEKEILSSHVSTLNALDASI